MKLSARNQLEGKIVSVDKGAVMANIKIEVTEPNTITAVIQNIIFTSGVLKIIKKCHDFFSHGSILIL